MVDAEAAGDLASLAFHLQAPVFTTFSSRGLLSPTDLCNVCLPPHEPEVEELLGRADLLIAVGTDFDGMCCLPAEIRTAADLPKVTAALMARGYTAEQMQKILGGNLLRVFREVEQVSKQLQAENRPRITEKQPFDKWQK